MKTLIIILAAFAASFSNTQGAWQMRVGFPGYENRGEILEYFPARVTFAEGGGFSFGTHQFADADCYDLRFYDSAGTELPYEIDSHDPGVELNVWVQVPTIKPDGSSFVIATWGDVSNGQMIYTTNGAVWADAGFNFVQHYNAVNGAASVADSSAAKRTVAVYEFDATPLTEGTTHGAGRIGPAIDLSQTATKSGMLVTSGNIPIGATWTISSWFKKLAPFGVHRTLTRGGNGSAADHHVLIGGPDKGVTAALGSWIGNLQFRGPAGATLTNDVAPYVWRQICAVGGPGSRITYYLDGESLGNITDFTSASIYAINWYPGASTGVNFTEASQKFADYLDEFRVATVARSADWVWASFMSEGGAAKFTAYGTPFAAGLPLVENLGAVVLGAYGAEFGCRLVMSDGSAPPTPSSVTAYWAFDDWKTTAGDWLAAAEGDCEAALPDGVDTTLYTAPAGGLEADTEYAVRFKVVLGGVEHWSEAVVFKTLGKPVFNSVSAKIPTPNSIEFAADIASCGAAPATVTLWMGTAENALVITNTWLNMTGATNIAHTVSGLQVGGEYWYAFVIDCYIDETANWLESSDTEKVVLGGVTTWVEPDTGDWHTGANWDNGVPGPGAVANFYKGGATVGAKKDLTVAQALFNAAGTMTFDLDGNTLFVGERMDVGGNAAVNFPAQNGAVLMLTNGVIDAGAGTVYVGAGTVNNTLVLEGTGGIKADTLVVMSGYQVSGNNLFQMTGPDARLETATLRVGSSRGYDNKIILRDCFVTNTQFRVGGDVNGNASQRSHVLLDNAEVQTASLLVDYYGGRLSTLLMSDSIVNVTGNMEIGHGGEGIDSHTIASNSVVNINGNVVIAYGNGDAQRNRITVHRDPGKISHVKVAGDCSIANYGGANNGIVANGGTFEVVGGLQTYDNPGQYLISTNGGLIKIGWTVMNNNRASGTGHRLEVYGENSRFESGSLVFSNAGNNGHNHLLRVESGTVAVAGNLNLNYNNNFNRMVVKGATSRVEAGSLTVNANATLEFTIPEGGFAQTPVYVTGSGNFSLNPNVKFEITPDGFYGKATLVECENGSINNILDPKDNFVFNLKKGDIAKPVQNGKSIAVRISPETTLLIVR